ncbi:tetratricopeptide repeat protein [Histidinibacterium lentulum]|nr:tetratricopeptide repeat protein [Histidinibacterium lentulum]
MNDVIKQVVASCAVILCMGAPATAETVDEMFERLAAASSAEEARRIEARIATEWSKSGSPAIDLLWQRGRDALEAGDAHAAIEHFTAAIDHAPGFAEAWHGRATAYFMAEAFGPALDDIRETLVLNPRHFGAMRGLAIIMEQIGEEETSIEVMDRILAIHPFMEDVAEARNRLTLRLDGLPL